MNLTGNRNYKVTAGAPLIGLRLHRSYSIKFVFARGLWPIYYLARRSRRVPGEKAEIIPFTLDQVHACVRT